MRTGDGGASSALKPGTCKTERGLLGATTCTPTREQVTATSDVPIVASATEFIATYEGFQDWNMQASFRVPLDEAREYTSLPNYPGAKVDGPAIEGIGAAAGQYRSLKLVTVDGMLQVHISVSTT